MASLDPDFLNQNLFRLPKCAPVYLKYADNLLYEETFLESFAILFISFNEFTSDVATYVTKCLRLSISKLIGKTHFLEMLALVFSSPLPHENRAKPLDVFFSALLDNTSQLVHYFSQINFFTLFDSQSIQIRSDLPKSFLQFLVLTSCSYPFTQDMLWNFIIESPALLFTYIDHLDDQNSIKLWIPILEKLIFLQRTEKTLDIQIDTLLYLISALKQHPILIKILLAKKIHQWMITNLWSVENEKTFAIERKLAFLGIILFFTRLDETIARTMTANVSINVLFEHFVSDEKSFSDVSDIFLWILMPSSYFAYSDNTDLDFTYFSDLCPSTTFLVEICPKILSLFMKYGIDEKVNAKIFEGFLQKLIKINEEKPYHKQMLLGGICKHDILIKLVPRALDNDVYFDFISICLSINCDFPCFSSIFKQISQNIEKTIRFLTILGKNTPIVNDFLHVDSPFPLSANIMNGSIVMWVRFMSFSSIILQFQTKNDLISIAHDSNYIGVQQNGKFIAKYEITNGIEGWHMIHVRIDKRGVSLSIDLEERALSVIFETNVTIILGGCDACFDMQSFRLFRPFLGRNDAEYLFALGPNTKEFLYRDFVSISIKNTSYVIENEYISSLYAKWASRLRHVRMNPEIFGSNFELSISPPFSSMIILRRTQSSTPLSQGFNSMNLKARSRSLSGNELNKSNSTFSLKITETQQTSSPQKRSKDIRKRDLPNSIDNTQLFSNRWSFIDFINSLEAHGGVSLLCHLFAESILKCDQLQDEMFDLLLTLINRFPLYHVAFSKRDLYDVLSNLLWAQNLKTSVIQKYAVLVDNSNVLLTNALLLKNFVLGPPLYHCDFVDLIQEIKLSITQNKQYSDLNKQMLQQIDAFTLIIQAISNSTQHSKELLEALGDLAFVLTTEETAEKNIKKLFSFIMINHLSFSMKDSEPYREEEKEVTTPLSEFRTRFATPSIMRTKKSASTLIRILNVLLKKFPNIDIPIELTLCSFVTSGVKIQISLVDLMFKHCPDNTLYLFSVVVQNLQHSTKMAQYLYAFAQALLHENDFKLHFITIPLLYMSKHNPDYNEYLFSLSKASIPIIRKIDKISPIIYEHILMIIQLIESAADFSSESFIVPLVMTLDGASISATVSSLSDFIVAVLTRGFETNDLTTVKKFFISIFALKYIPDYKLAAFSLFLLARVLERISSQKAFNSTAINSFIPFVLVYTSFVFNRIHLIPGDRSEILSNIILYVMHQIIITIDKHNLTNNSLDTQNKLYDTLVDLSSLNMNTETIVDHIKSTKHIPKNKSKFSEAIDRLENPTSYTLPKTKKPPFEQELKKYEEMVAQRDKKDTIALITLCCNAISFQTQKASDIAPVSTNIDTIIEQWHQIFDSLFNENTLIFKDCPIKYKLNDTTTDPYVRKLLFPINPATDRIYSSFWEKKYKTQQPPELRLTISDVMQYTPQYYMENDVLFNGDSTRLVGISMLRGVLVVTRDSIKFYQKPKSCSFFEELVKIPFSQLKQVRLTVFQHQQKGVIVEDTVNGLFIFALETPSLRERFVDVLQNLQSSQPIKIIFGIDKEEISKVTQMWCDYKISTFEYLLKLNFISGRNWTDFTQFPIFPWTILDYESETRPQKFRDLTYPVFAQSPQQRESCLNYYKATVEMGSSPHCFPNYVSNVGSALYFLVRLEPFTDEEIFFQNGSLDAADRTFQSLAITSSLMLSPSSKSALELVPEVYFVPEMYENVNNIVFPVSPINKRDISNVDIPKWAKCDPQRLTKMLRKSLESPETSENLNQWIDLIWGVRREGPLALERCNCLQSIIFSFDPEQYVNDRIMFKAVIDQIHNCGQAPIQLFTDFHPKRGKKQTPYTKLCLKVSNEKTLPLNDDGLQFKIKRPDGWHKLSNGYKVRVSCASIEYSKVKQNITSFTFADEIRPICIQTDGNDIVTSHKMPVLNHWLSTEFGLKHKASLCGHLEKITFVQISNFCKLIISGHTDGMLSIFTVHPHRFLRIADTNKRCPVTGIHIIQPTSAIVVFQRIIKSNVPITCLTLFSCNGKILATSEIFGDVIDCCSTSFVVGTQKNYVVLLTKEKIILMTAESLKIKEEHNIGEPQPISIAVWGKNNIFIARSDNTLAHWNLIPFR